MDETKNEAGSAAAAECFTFFKEAQDAGWAASRCRK
jgi:hypothetical protein